MFGGKKARILDSITFAFLALVVWLQIFPPADKANAQVGSLALVSLGLLILGFFVSLALNKSGVKTLGESVFEPPFRKAETAPTPLLKSFWGWQLLVAFLAAFYVGLLVTEFDFYDLTDEDGINGARRIFGALLSPNFEILPSAILAIVETIFIAFMATTLSIPVAFILAFFAAKNIIGTNPMGFAVYATLRTLLNVSRSIEPLIWAIIFSVWVGIGPFAGMLALMLHSIASLTKQYSEMIESVDEGPIEGIASTGANRTQTVWFGVVPQIILPYVSFTIYRWDINVRMATIIGLVGGGGIGTMLIHYQGQALWHEVGCIVAVIAVVVWSMDTASAYIREALK